MPMRGGSERVPNKNLREVAGLPLFCYGLQVLQSLSFVDEVVVNTDSVTIASAVQERFPSVSIYHRPTGLGTGSTPMTEVLTDFLSNVDAHSVLQVHSTSPFVQAQSIERAYKRFRSVSECDSVFSVSKMQGRLWEGGMRPLNHDPQVLERTQDLDPVFLENSAFYIFDRRMFVETQMRIGPKPIMHELTVIESIDIDTEEDLFLAEVVALGLSARAQLLMDGTSVDE